MVPRLHANRERPQQYVFHCRSNLTLIDRLSLVDAFMSWTASYGMKVLGLVVPWLYLLFGIKAVYADLSELLRYLLAFLRLARIHDGVDFPGVARWRS